MKIYFDKNLMKVFHGEYVPFLFPLLWDARRNANRIWLDDLQVKLWIEYWKKIISYCDAVWNCDFMVFPIELQLDYFDLLQEYCKIWKKNNKLVVAFYFSDDEYPIPNEYGNLIVFRTSLNKHSPKNEFAMPGFTADLWKIWGISDKIADLSVSYCWYGWCHGVKWFLKRIFINFKLYLFDNKFVYYLILNNKWLVKVRKVLEKFHLVPKGWSFKWLLIHLLTSLWKWFIYRSKVIKKINLTKIEFRIIERDKILNRNVSGNLKDEYVHNIKSSLFPLVMRWNWNYSFRLSEVLSLWKIPLFIDTDCRLPFEELIDYKKFFCWCEYSELSDVEGVVQNFYKRSDLIMVQKKMRDLYDDYFSFYGFHKQLCKKLQDNNFINYDKIEM